MPGTLHIFRLKADPPQYQANYNLGTRSYLRVFNAAGIEEFLTHNVLLPNGEAARLLAELHSSGHATEATVGLSETHLGEMGFTETPSEE
jgi:hypothetical protein